MCFLNNVQTSKLCKEVSRMASKHRQVRLWVWGESGADFASHSIDSKRERRVSVRRGKTVLGSTGSNAFSIIRNYSLVYIPLRNSMKQSTRCRARGSHICSALHESTTASSEIAATIKEIALVNAAPLIVPFI